MTSDDLEFSISQYADGTLPAAERPRVEAALAADPAARRVLAEYQRLTELLVAPPAGIDWARLALHLSAAVDGGRSGPPAVAGRIGPARSAPWRSPWRLGSIAAAAVLAVTVGLLAHRPRAAVAPGGGAASVSVAEVTGPTVEAGTGRAQAEVSIGPSPALAARAGSGRYAEGVISRTPTVVIAGAERLPPAGPGPR